MARDFGHDVGIDRRGQAQPAVLLTDGRAEQTHFGHLIDQLGRPDIAVIVMFDDGDDFAFQPTVDRIHERALLLFIETGLRVFGGVIHNNGGPVHSAATMTRGPERSSAARTAAS